MLWYTLMQQKLGGLERAFDVITVKLAVKLPFDLIQDDVASHGKENEWCDLKGQE